MKHEAFNFIPQKTKINKDHQFQIQSTNGLTKKATSVAFYIDPDSLITIPKESCNHQFQEVGTHHSIQLPLNSSKLLNIP